MPVVVKENNLKTSTKDRFDKNKPPKRDPEARLGVMIHFKKPFHKKAQYLWGYRNHSITDCDSELPLWELTRPANVQDTTLFISLFKKLLDHFDFDIQDVMADASYDSESNLKFVIDQLHALPRIARNVRWQKLREVNLSSSGVRICIAGFRHWSLLWALSTPAPGHLLSCEISLSGPPFSVRGQKLISFSLDTFHFLSPTE